MNEVGLADPVGGLPGEPRSRRRLAAAHRRPGDRLRRDRPAADRARRGLRRRCWSRRSCRATSAGRCRWRCRVAALGGGRPRARPLRRQRGPDGITTLADALAVDRPTLFLWGTLLALALGSVLLIADRSVEPGGAFVAGARRVPGDGRRPTACERAAEERGYGSPDQAPTMQTEVFPFTLFALGGMMAFVAANDLLTMFVALEVLSLPLYLMCGLARRRRLLSQEAAVKYFLLGAFASAFFLYGLALLYGYAGSVRLADIAEAAAGLRPLRRAAARRARAAGGRPDVQGLGRPVPHLDAGRLPGRADAGHRVHGRLHQGRRVRRDPAGAVRRLRRHPLGVARRAVGRRDRLDGDRRGASASPRPTSSA